MRCSKTGTGGSRSSSVRPPSGTTKFFGSLKRASERHMSGPAMLAKTSSDIQIILQDQDMRSRSWRTRMHASALRRKCESIVQHPMFNRIIAATIIVNAIYMGIETDNAGSDDDQNKFPWFFMEIIFVAIFFTELCLRICSEGVRFFCDPWNSFDSFLVVLSTVDVLVFSSMDVAGHVFDLSSVLRVTRSLRLVRIFRIFRLLRFFKELWLLVAGLIGSMKTICWAWILVFLTCFLGAILTTRMLGSDGNEELEEYFGSVAKSMFTLFQVVTVDEWVTIAQAASDHYWAAPFLMLFMLLTTYAIMNVVAAVMVERTMENSNKHRKVKLQHAAEDLQGASDKIRDIFNLGDVDGSQTLTKTEYMDAIGQPEVMRFLHEVGVDIHKAESLFDVLDYDESGRLDETEFVQGVMNARGAATSKDVLEMQCGLWRWERNFDRRIEALRVETDRGLQQLYSELDTVRELIGSIGRRVQTRPVAPTPDAAGERGRPGLGLGLTSWAAKTSFDAEAEAPNVPSSSSIGGSRAGHVAFLTEPPRSSVGIPPCSGQSSGLHDDDATSQTVECDQKHDEALPTAHVPGAPSVA